MYLFVGPHSFGPSDVATNMGGADHKHGRTKGLQTGVSVNRNWFPIIWKDKRPNITNPKVFSIPVLLVQSLHGGALQIATSWFVT